MRSTSATERGPKAIDPDERARGSNSSRTMQSRARAAAEGRRRQRRLDGLRRGDRRRVRARRRGGRRPLGELPTEEVLPAFGKTERCALTERVSGRPDRVNARAPARGGSPRRSDASTRDPRVAIASGRNSCSLALAERGAAPPCLDSEVDRGSSTGRRSMTALDAASRLDASTKRFRPSHSSSVGAAGARRLRASHRTPRP